MASPRFSTLFSNQTSPGGVFPLLSSCANSLHHRLQNKIFLLNSRTLVGWVGLGISSNGGMKGADIALLIQDSSGRLGVRDMWSNRTATPYLDIVQNKRLIAAETKQENGVTHFVFTRRLSACGEEDFPIVRNSFFLRPFIDALSNLSLPCRPLVPSGLFEPLETTTFSPIMEVTPAVLFDWIFSPLLNRSPNPTAPLRSTLFSLHIISTNT